MRQIQVVEQQVPGEAVSGDENESKGLPDAWFYDDGVDNSGWAVVIESKIQAGISLNQLERHARTGKRYGYERTRVVLIAVDQPKKLLPENVRSIEWRKVYEWFNKQSNHSTWALVFVEYMRAFESQMIAKNYNIRGTITMFDGLHFHKAPYTYREGKRLIRLFRSELQKHPGLRKLGIDTKGEGRTAITGSGQESVWDFLSLKDAHGAKLTKYPHLTIDLTREYASAATSVPNGVKGGFRSKLKESGLQGVQALILKIEKRLRPVIKQTGAPPMINVHQRHFKTQRSTPVTDARLIADLRTLVPLSGSKVKYQPKWLSAIYEVLCHKRSTNIHLGVEVRFPYDGKAIASHKIVDLYAKAWIAMSPLLDFVLDRK